MHDADPNEEYDLDYDDIDELDEIGDGEQLVPVWFATHSDDEWHRVPPEAFPPAQDLMMQL